jgi:peptidoglycan-N-acetylglucosamine deacetylase
MRFAGFYHTAISASVSLLPSLLPNALCRLPDSGSVAVTIDDGPNPAGTPAALKALAYTGMTATFFVTGAQAESCPSLLRAIVNQGHAIASHGYMHEDFFFANAEHLRQDVLRSLDVIEQRCGIRPQHYRPPYGRLNPFHTHIPDALGCDTVLWNRMPRDFDPKQKGASLLNNLRSVRGGDILVLHDNADTVGRLPGIIHALSRHLREKQLYTSALPGRTVRV